MKAFLSLVLAAFVAVGCARSNDEEVAKLRAEIAALKEKAGREQDTEVGKLRAERESLQKKTGAEPPIIAVFDLMRSGRRADYEIHAVGKIYNPNTVGLRNIRVAWHIYKKPSDEGYAKALSDFGFEEYLSTEIAFLPPKATFDFKTNRIRSRDFSTVETLGAKEGDEPSRLPPEITFKADQ